MTQTMLVTGATGTLGKDVVAVLRERGHDVRGLSRNKPGHVHADLSTGEGLDEAVAGVDVIIHAATDGRKDPAATANLIRAAERAGRPRLIFVSIVGVDRIPLGYYRDKVAIEGQVRRYGGAILRATQFHELVLTMAKATTRMPIGFYPAFDFQPVATWDVALKLADMVDSGSDHEEIGGPYRSSAKELWQAYLRKAGRKRILLPLRLPGKIFRGYREGAHTTERRSSGQSWAEFLEEVLPSPAVAPGENGS